LFNTLLKQYGYFIDW